jgi:hypothetical protein
MKFQATIFILLAFAATLERLPGRVFAMMENTDCKKEKCCSGKKHALKSTDKADNKPSKDNDCSDDACKRFICCTCCCYLVSERPYLDSTGRLLASIKQELTNEKVISSYISDCWHPPESV